MILSNAVRGESVIISNIENYLLTKRYYDMGFFPGARLKVQNSRGGMIVESEGTRYAIAKRTASKIYITLAE